MSKGWCKNWRCDKASRDKVNNEVLGEKYFLAQREGRAYIYPTKYKEISQRDEVILQESRRHTIYVSSLNAIMI